jgi:hypothetical protein
MYECMHACLLVPEILNMLLYTHTHGRTDARMHARTHTHTGEVNCYHARYSTTDPIHMHTHTHTYTTRTKQWGPLLPRTIFNHRSHTHTHTHTHTHNSEGKRCHARYSTIDQGTPIFSRQFVWSPSKDQVRVSMRESMIFVCICTWMTVFGHLLRTRYVFLYLKICSQWVCARIFLRFLAL